MAGLFAGNMAGQGMQKQPMAPGYQPGFNDALYGRTNPEPGAGGWTPPPQGFGAGMQFMPPPGGGLRTPPQQMPPAPQAPQGRPMPPRQMAPGLSDQQMGNRQARWDRQDARGQAAQQPQAPQMTQMQPPQDQFNGFNMGAGLPGDPSAQGGFGMGRPMQQVRDPMGGMFSGSGGFFGPGSPFMQAAPLSPEIQAQKDASMAAAREEWARNPPQLVNYGGSLQRGGGQMQPPQQMGGGGMPQPRPMGNLGDLGAYQGSGVKSMPMQQGQGSPFQNMNLGQQMRPQQLQQQPQMQSMQGGPLSAVMQPPQPTQMPQRPMQQQPLQKRPMDDWINSPTGH